MQEYNRQKQKFLCFQVQHALFNKHGRNAEEKAAARQGALGHGHPLLKRSSTGLVELTGLRKSFFLPRLTKTKCSQVFLGQSGCRICLGCSRFPSGKIGSKQTKFGCCPAVNSGLRSCNLPSSAQIKNVSKWVPL